MNTLRNFHVGEAQLQVESGVDSEAFDAMVSMAFRPELSDPEVRFVNGRTFVVAATVDEQGRPWASPLFGPAGNLLSVIDRRTVHIRPHAGTGDPLIDNIVATGELGVLYFDPSLRRRAKSLGRGQLDEDGTLIYQMHRNYGLCNKYIFKRTHEPAAVVSDQQCDAESSTAEELTVEDRSQLLATDTAFLASFHSDHGADATHRGGPAGFITVIDDSTISLPDYMGNGMFQTLGNLLLDERVALMTVDFTTGRGLHLTGRGQITASEDDTFSERTLTIAIDEVRTSYQDPGTWTDIEAFELRPGLINPATPYLDR